MKIPEYTKNSIYQELANICESAGRPIKYVELDERIAGRTNKYALIEMPDTEIEDFDKPDIPILVLGHELGHCLCENSSSTFVKTFENLIVSAKQYTDVSRFFDECEELICDIAGEFLYSLAEMIAMNKSEAVSTAMSNDVNQ